MIRRIQIPPGLVRESTQLAAGNSWYDSNNMRFRNSKAEMIGGWVRDGSYTLEGIGRSTFSSKDYVGNNYQWVGTDWKWYIITGDLRVDITPDRSANQSLGSNPFAVTSGLKSKSVLVTDNGHGASVNDFVRFTGAVDDVKVSSDVWNSVDGYQIYSIVDVDSYWIELPVASLGAGSVGGTAPVKAYYKVSSGAGSQVDGQGYGAGAYGGDDFFPDEFAFTASPLWTNSSTDHMNFEVSATDWPSVTLIGSNAYQHWVYFTGLNGTVGGINLAILNEKWLPVSSIPGGGTGLPTTQYLNLDLSVATAPFNTGMAPQVVTSTTTDQEVTTGAPVAMYRALGTAATGFTMDSPTSGATRGWGDSSTAATLVASTRRTYIDNYGEDIMFCNSGGPIYYYDVSKQTSGGVPGDGVGNVGESLDSFTGNSLPPTTVDSFLISKRDGHAVALGCNDLNDTSLNSMLVRWSDQNDPFVWLPSPSNTAGGQVLRVGSKIVGGISTKDEVVIFTDAAVYSMRFTGPPSVFSFSLITGGVEIVGPRTVANASNMVFFMGNDGFYTYTGTVNPLDCPVSSYVFDEFNFNQKDKAFAAVNSAFSEVTWFYPSSVPSTDPSSPGTVDSFEPDRYVTYNYEDNVWTIGTLDMGSLPETPSTPAEGEQLNRTSWRDSIVFSSPMATYISAYDPTVLDGPIVRQTQVMIHETGTKANDAPLNAHIESGEVEISDGERFSLLSRLIPDMQLFNHSGAASPVVTVDIMGRDFPGDSSEQKTSTDVTFSSTANTHTPTGNATAIRGRARSVSIRISSSSSGYQWRMGSFRFDIRPDGRR